LAFVSPPDPGEHSTIVSAIEGRAGAKMSSTRQQGNVGGDGGVLVPLRVLGEVEAWVGGERVEIGHARQRCVLAVLLIEANLVVTTEQLVDRVWAGNPPYRGRQAVSNYVSRLRHVLTTAGEVTIQRRGGGYILQVEPESVDLHLFRRLVGRAHNETDEHQALRLLEQGAAMWRGNALSDLDTPWITSVREGLAMERFAADATRIDLALQLGQHAELLPELTTRAAAHPLDERVAGQLILALYRSGRQAEALGEVERTRTRLAEELGIDPGPALRQLHQRVLANDPALTVPVPGIRMAADVPVPRQLPAPARSFTGRAPQLARLTKALAPLTVASGGGTPAPVSVISGAGGIGKTWLAVTWAYRNAGQFPDGQLFVDLRGFSPDRTPMSAEVALRGFLTALGVDADHLPADPHAQAALFRSLTADRRMLVVLDNAAGTSQVTPLLPGGNSCTVLVTSRHRLSGLISGRGAHHVHLDVLTGQESHDLLTRRLGPGRVRAEPAAAAKLVELCGGFPLALGIAAARAQVHPEIPLAGSADELGDLDLEAFTDDDPSASLPTVVSWSFRVLSGEQQEVFGLLSVVPGLDVSLLAAASLTGLPAAGTRAVLRGLEDASLLTRDAQGRYRMHDLIRRCAVAHQHVSGQAREAALGRLLDFYLHTAYTADRLLNPHALPIRLDPPTPGSHVHPLADVPAALAWLDAEHANLLAAQHIAADLGKHHVVWQLAWVLLTFHDRREHHHDEFAMWRAALDAAAHMPDPTARIVAHRRLGAVCVELGRHEEAIDHLHQALALAEHHRDLPGRAHTHYQLAWAWGRRGDDRLALEHAGHALELCRAADLPVWKADALNAVGWHAARLGDHVTARTHCRAALFLQRHHHNGPGEANALHSLGYIDHLIGRDAQAVRKYNQALDLYRDHGVTPAQARTTDRLGHSHAALGQRDQAYVVWQEALRLYQAQGRDEQVEGVERQLDALGHPDSGNSGRTASRPA
jgi:DNA-binding SARP family transcriptional activator/tetratricopeptide (TPR) repeat protein